MGVEPPGQATTHSHSPAPTHPSLRGHRQHGSVKKGDKRHRDFFRASRPQMSRLLIALRVHLCGLSPPSAHRLMIPHSRACVGVRIGPLEVSALSWQPDLLTQFAGAAHLGHACSSRLVFGSAPRGARAPIDELCNCLQRARLPAWQKCTSHKESLRPQTIDLQFRRL